MYPNFLKRRRKMDSQIAVILWLSRTEVNLTFSHVRIITGTAKFQMHTTNHSKSTCKPRNSNLFEKKEKKITGNGTWHTIADKLKHFICINYFLSKMRPPTFEPTKMKTRNLKMLFQIFRENCLHTCQDVVRALYSIIDIDL